MLGDEPVRVEPEEGDPEERVLLVGGPEDRPVLDSGAARRRQWLTEPELERLLVLEGLPRVLARPGSTEVRLAKRV